MSDEKLVAAMAVLLCCLAYEGPQVLAASGESPKLGQPAGKDPAKAKQIEKLIRQLGDNDYYARERAQDELARMRFDAFDALSAAASDEDLEIASRAKYLLRRMPIEWTTESDPADVKHCLQRYDRQDAKSRKAAMKELIGLPHGRRDGSPLKDGALREGGALEDGGGDNHTSHAGWVAAGCGSRR